MKEIAKELLKDFGRDLITKLVLGFLALIVIAIVGYFTVRYVKNLPKEEIVEEAVIEIKEIDLEKTGEKTREVFDEFSKKKSEFLKGFNKKDSINK